MKSKNKFTLGQEKSCRRYKIMPYMLNCVCKCIHHYLKFNKMKQIIGKFILANEQVKSGGKLNFCLFKGLKLSHFMRNRLKKNCIYICSWFILFYLRLH